jgi:Eco29kI-like restriction endonuclease
MADLRPFNPLDKKNLGVSVADALIVQKSVPLSEVKPFRGAGIYAIYYRGSFPAYAPLVAKNSNRLSHPIYVGKAVPAGARKGGFGLGADPGQVLFKRLREHAETVGQVGLQDFYCRYLVVDDIWIPLGEAMLIEQFRPIWNMLVDGFGNHDPGKGRYNQQRSAWDTLHPGRPWASKCQTYSRTARYSKS